MRNARRRNWLLVLSTAVPLAASAGAPPLTWGARSSGTTRGLHAVAYGNGVFVAVGEAGTVLTSFDGAAWTARASGTTRSLHGVTYDAWSHAFVAVGDLGTIVVSGPDAPGISWSAAPALTTDNLRAVATVAIPRQTGGANVVAVGSTTSVVTRHPFNGPWTVHDLPTPVLAVASNGGPPNPSPALVAVGVRGTVLRSADGVDWTSLSCGYSGHLSAITHHLENGSPEFLAVGQEYSSAGMTQSFVHVDGTSCDVLAAPASLGGLASLAYGSLAAGDDYLVGAGLGQIVLSQRGYTSWAVVASGTPHLGAVTYGAGSFVAVGERGAIYQSPAGRPASAGCFTSWKDGVGLALPTLLMGSGATVESCREAAWSAGYAYAGVQYYGQCYGGDWIAFGRAPDWECNTPCSADPRETCGGAWRNSVYATGTGTPIASPAASFVGCFTSWKDGVGLALPKLLISSGATIESCMAAARAWGYPYAGVQYYGQCYGGGSMAFDRVADSECSTPCDAKPGERCGGVWRNGVYATGAGTPVPGVAASYLGCYVSWKDGVGLALPTLLMGSGATIESCMAAARKAGYRYAGVQYYGQCYGGNAIAFDRAADSDCDTPCTANRGEMCGGIWRNSVYATGS